MTLYNAEILWSFEAKSKKEAQEMLEEKLADMHMQDIVEEFIVEKDRLPD